jgi:hypothetical protein
LPQQKLVCRDAEKHLGSHMRTARRCKTPEQWQEEDAERSRIPLRLNVVSEQGDGTQPSRRPQ